MVYCDAIKYLESFINYEKISAWPYQESLKLKRIQGFLKSIGNPHDGLSYIHIAGSKGKGSTCVFIAYILREAGFKVGLYTSPHLVDFRERIRVLLPLSSSLNSGSDFEGMIAKKDLVRIIQQLKPAIEEYNRISKYGELSFFEVYTVLAFSYFKEKKVDFVVLETGMGGRLDATNVVTPAVCVITPISYEHTQKLGKTLTKIATEKSKIIKRIVSTPGPRLKYLVPASFKLPVISAPQEKEVLSVLRDRCIKTGARLSLVGKDICYKETKNGFNIMGDAGDYLNLRVSLKGRHQFVNASAAVAAVESLRWSGVIVGADAVRRGLASASWPGRCEVVSRQPLVVLDGAQNVASVKVLKNALSEVFKYGRLILVLGISDDKDIKGICNEFYDFADEIIVTEARNPRASRAQELARHFYLRKVYIKKNILDAKAFALELADKKDLILFSGSLFVVGEARQLFKKSKL